MNSVAPMGRVLALFLLLAQLACGDRDDYQPRDGDIVFQVSRSSQSLAIQKATGSPYSHTGLIFLEGGEAHVLEAVDRVRRTPLDAWIARGVGGRFVAKRLASADAVLSSEALLRMRERGEAFVGRDYDDAFDWSDERIYCSELIWKVYEGSLDLEVGETQLLGELDLSDSLVRRKLMEQFGPAIPLGETVISPGAIFASPLLKTVYKN